jgi:lipoprotein-releasing system permease protein
MPYELFLAFRYLRAWRGRRLVRVTALVALAGVASGVAALIVALALANGFRDEMRDKILRGTAHITLLNARGGPLTDWRETARRVRAVNGVASVAATTYTGALLRSESGAAYAVIRGVDTESERAIAEVRRTLISGQIGPVLNDGMAALRRAARTNAAEPAAEPDAIPEAEQNAPPIYAIIGDELARRTDLRVGDEATIVAAGSSLFASESVPAARSSSADSRSTSLFTLENGNGPTVRRVRIAGIFRLGLYEYDATWVYVALPAAADLMGAPFSASALMIETTNIDAAAQVAENVRASLGDRFTVIDWQEANRPLFAALSLERRVILLIIALITLVAALHITTALTLVVIERRSDIAILRAMGARAGSIMLIFLMEGAMIGGFGAGLGVALGLAAARVGDRYDIVKLPADVYSISAVPFHASARDAVWTALAAFALSLLATLYPARAAARIRPAEVLRYE